MLNIVLKKLIECTKTRNSYAVKGHLDAANRCVAKHLILDECLEEAGYKVTLKTKPVRSTGGLFEGLTLNYVTAIELTMPHHSDITDVKKVGFKCNGNSHIAVYEFDWKEI